MPNDLKSRIEDLRQNREELKTKLREEVKMKTDVARAKVSEVRKRVLLKLIDVQVRHFEKTNERAQRMPNVTDALKASLKVEIDKAIAVLNALKPKVEAANTRDALVAVSKEIRDSFKARRDIVKKIVDAVHASRLLKLTEKFDKAVMDAEAKIAEAKTAGKDVAMLEAKLTEVKNKLMEAKNLVTQGKLEEAAKVYQMVRKLLGEIKDGLEA